MYNTQGGIFISANPVDTLRCRLGFLVTGNFDKTGVHRLFSGYAENFFQGLHLTNHHRGGVEGVFAPRTWSQK
jgi:hypothetical protein